MVSVVQLVEHQVVILDVAGSSPVTHPAGQRVFFTSLPIAFPDSLQRYCNARGLATLLATFAGDGQPILLGRPATSTSTRLSIEKAAEGINVSLLFCYVGDICPGRSDNGAPPARTGQTWRCR
jgi:hypothetical protein